jgi:hypothetical protein
MGCSSAFGREHIASPSRQQSERLAADNLYVGSPTQIARESLDPGQRDFGA